MLNERSISRNIIQSLSLIERVNALTNNTTRQQLVMNREFK